MEPAHEEHHLSVWPLMVGIALFFTYLGFSWLKAPYGLPILGVGLVLVVVAVVGWVREDTKIFPRTFAPTEGRHIGWWGMVYFLVTEFMLFGALFAAYFATRARADLWPPEGAPALPLLLTGINTLILVSSGATMHWAQHNIQHDQRKKFIWGLVATLVLGGIFLAIQVYEYTELIAHGLVWGTSTYANLFFILTGTHGLHVFAGLVFIATLLFRGLAGNFNAKQHVAVEAAGIYWHFVDVVWIFLYVVLYLRWL